MSEIILASASPRRKELLGIITNDFLIIPSTAEESIPQNTDVMLCAEYLAKIKARDVAVQYPEKIVIGADTCVIAENEILGKPKDKADAERMLKMISGKTHFVVTGCAVCKGEKIVSFSNFTEVEFFPLSEKEIEEYINTDEPYDKAGAYGIQGKGGLFVKGIKGDYFNVVGLPVSQLNMVLKEF